MWEACGRDALAAPLVVMMAHLAVGDVWNFITNREKRLGVSAAGVCLLPPVTVLIPGGDSRAARAGLMLCR